MAMNKETLSYKIEDGVLVWIRNDITDFVVPNGVEEVAELAIHENIRRIVFADSVKKFTIPKNNSIEEIILPKEIRRYNVETASNGEIINYSINNLGLQNLKMLKSLGIPRNDYCIVAHGYYHDVSDLFIEKANITNLLKCNGKVIIRYDVFDDLIEYGMEYIRSVFPQKQRKMIVEFVGPPLSKKEKRYIEDDVKRYDRHFSVRFSSLRQEEKDEYELNIDDNEIELIVEEINKLCIKLPEETKNKIIYKVNKLIVDYQVKLEQFKPKYEMDSNILLELTDVSSLKPVLLANLIGIKMRLLSEKTLVNLISEIDGYSELLNRNVDKQIDDNSLMAKINNFLFYANTLDEERKNLFLNKLKKVLENIKDKITNELSVIKDDSVLSLVGPIDYRRQLEDNVSTLLDEVKLMSERVVPFRNMLMALLSNDNNLNNDEDSIEYMISRIKYILLNIKDQSYKKELDDKYKEIFDKYIGIINNILSNDEQLNEANYQNLELKFRKDIDTTLKLTSKYAYLEQVGIHGFDKNDINAQLKKSIELINTGKIVRIDEKLSEEIITSFVCETLNVVINSYEIPTSEKNNIINDLSGKLIKHMNKLKTKEIKSLKEYNDTVREVLSSIALVNLNVSLYINRIKTYNKYSK